MNTMEVVRYRQVPELASSGSTATEVFMVTIDRADTRVKVSADRHQRFGQTIRPENENAQH